MANLEERGKGERFRKTAVDLLDLKPRGRGLGEGDFNPANRESRLLLRSPIPRRQQVRKLSRIGVQKQHRQGSRLHRLAIVGVGG